MKLDGKVAIVTGSGQGIGEAIAVTLAKEGAKVVIADINEETAQDVAGRIASYGGEALAIKTNVTKSSDVSQMVEQTLTHFGRVDILVNNAGTTIPSPTEQLSEEDWDKVVTLNLKGTFLCCREVGKHMIKQRSGKIVSIASLAAHKGLAHIAAYAASKAGICGFSRELAVEWGKYNINVNTISPSTTVTPLLLRYFKEQGIDPNAHLKYVPLERDNTPEDIANAVLFLVSTDSRNITGEDIVVDGGTNILYWPEKG